MSLTDKHLRAMHNRWESDLRRLRAVYPVEDWESCDAATETIRNLATAIVHIEAMITSRPEQQP